MTTYAIRRIEPLSAFKYGLSIGALLMFPTGLLVGLFTSWIVRIVVEWMESWGTLEVQSVLGVGLEINLLNIVELADFLEMLRGLNEMGFLLVLAIIFIMVVFGGLFIGFQCTLAAWAYNWGAAARGGVIIKAEMLDRAAVIPPLHQGAQWLSQTQELPQGLPQSLPQKQPPAPQPPPNWHHSRLSGPSLVSSHDGRRYPIKAGNTLIGSASNNDLVIYGLAPYHAEIRFEEQRYIIYDRGSQQILVNERPIMGPNMLKDGFRVRLGRIDFVFKEEV